jgi:hypothetical protein
MAPDILAMMRLSLFHQEMSTGWKRRELPRNSTFARLFFPAYAPTGGK